MSNSSASPLQPWPPVWKKLEECPQYQCGILPVYENMKSQMLRDFGEKKTKPPNWDRYLSFLDQVIDSRGYDYENCPEEFFGKSFTLQILPDAAGSARLMLWINFVVNKINEEAQKHGEQYEYDGYVKAVDSSPHRCILITMSVKNGAVVKVVQAMVYSNKYIGAAEDYELVEWRFKPT